jgi:ketosteroid isomerase-like protein
MTTQEIANRLVELCRQGQNVQAINELYHDEVVSLESDGQPLEAKGIDAVRGKSEWWSNTFEVHGATVSDPLVAANHFTVAMSMDTTHKESGERSQMEEICLYEVNDGKIVREQFFYPKQG